MLRKVTIISSGRPSLTWRDDHITVWNSGSKITDEVSANLLFLWAQIALDISWIPVWPQLTCRYQRTSLTGITDRLISRESSELHWLLLIKDGSHSESRFLIGEVSVYFMYSFPFHRLKLFHDAPRRGFYNKSRV